MKKVGIIAVVIGSIIIFVLLAVILFVHPPKTASQTFKGPTSAPYVKGPTELPPK